MVELKTYKSREEWLKARENRIGGSDAACIIGQNPYKSNQRLWEEKTGRKAAEDISNKDVVIYGNKAEPLLRELFRLDYPELLVSYEENNMFLNDRFPFAHASLDGWLKDPAGRNGVWECKTTEIQNSAMKEKWNNRIPDNYYCQVLHYLMVTEFDFAILTAQLKFNIDGEIYKQTRTYRINREDVEEDINYLAGKEAEFYEDIKNNKKPALILPEI